MRLERVEWWDVPEAWPGVQEWIARALAHGGGGYLLADILRALLCRQMKLWLVKDGAALKACAVTQITFLPRLKICQILVVGGSELESWAHVVGDIEAWARKAGCDAVDGPGRMGWSKKAAQYGYAPVMTLFRKRL